MLCTLRSTLVISGQSPMTTLCLAQAFQTGACTPGPPSYPPGAAIRIIASVWIVPLELCSIQPVEPHIVP